MQKVDLQRVQQLVIVRIVGNVHINQNRGFRGQ